MKRWLGLALAWVGAVCLLLGLAQRDAVKGMNSHPGLGWGRGAGWLGAPALASPTTALTPTARNPGRRQAGAGPLESLTLGGVLLAERQAPPLWLDTRGPPGSVQGTWVDRGLPTRPVAQRKGGVRFPQEVHAPRKGTTPEEGVLQQPLASRHLLRRP